MIGRSSFVALSLRSSHEHYGRIAPGKIRRVFSLCCVSLVFACAALYGLALLAQQPARLIYENSRLRAENEEQRRQLYSFAGRMESIEDASRRLAEASGVDAFAVNDEQARRDAGGPYIEVSDARFLVVAEEQADNLLEELETYTEMIARERSRVPSIWPTVGVVTDRFGFRRNPFGAAAAEMHTGQDISAPPGTPVIAAGSGQVEFAGTQNGYGNVVIIAHGDGLTTRYAHLSAIETEVGASVERGQMIGRVGSTGRSSGPHLHYEVRVGENPVDPRRYLPHTAN